MHERRATERTINPTIWLLMGWYEDEAFSNDFATVFSGNDETVKQFLEKGLALNGFLPANKFTPSAKPGTGTNRITSIGIRTGFRYHLAATGIT